MVVRFRRSCYLFRDSGSTTGTDSLSVLLYLVAESVASLLYMLLTFYSETRQFGEKDLMNDNIILDQIGLSLSLNKSSPQNRNFFNFIQRFRNPIPYSTSLYK